MPSSGIQIGDAVLEFLGDDTNLQEAFERVNIGAKTAIRPAANDVTQLQERVKALELELTALNAKFAQMGTEGKAAGREVANSMKEAKGEIALLGEAVGVGVPRHIRGFITQLPGVATALEAAFSATAVFFLIQIVIEVTKKVTEFITEVFILNEAMKQVGEVVIETNKSIIEQRLEMEKLRNEYNLMGLTGSAKVIESFRQLTVEAEKTNAQFRLVSDTMFGLRNNTVDTSAALNVLTQQFKLANPNISQEDLDKKTKAFIGDPEAILAALQNFYVDYKTKSDVFNQKFLNSQKEFNEATLQEEVATLKARADALKSIGEARINAQLAQQKVLNVGLLDEYYQDFLAEQKANDQKYKNTLEYYALQREASKKQLEDKISNLEVEKALNAQEPKAVEAINNEILALQNQFKASTIKIDSDIATARLAYITQIREQTKTFLDGAIAEEKKYALQSRTIVQANQEIAGSFKDITQVGQVLVDDFNPVVTTILKATDAFKTLGLEGSAPLRQKIDEQQKAVSALADAYLAGLGPSLHDVLEAELILIQTKIADVQASDLNTAAKKRETAALQQQAVAIQKQLIPQISTWKKVQHEASQDVQQALGAAVAAYANGSATIGQALKMMVQQILSSLASQAIVEAVVELAKGFAALSPLSPDFGHAGEHFTSAAIWGTVGAAAAVAGRALAPSSGAGGGAPGTGVGAIQTSPTSGVGAPQQTPVVKTTPLNSGIITQNTLALINPRSRGDATSATDAAIAKDIMFQDFMEKAGLHKTEVHVHVKGDLIDHSALVGHISQGVKDGKYRLTSNTALDTKKRG